jgi:hypothetical protein
LHVADKLTFAAGRMHLELFPDRVIRICHTDETLAAGRFRSISRPTVKLARFPCLQPCPRSAIRKLRASWRVVVHHHAICKACGDVAHGCLGCGREADNNSNMQQREPAPAARCLSTPSHRSSSVLRLR